AGVAVPPGEESARPASRLPQRRTGLTVTGAGLSPSAGRAGGARCAPHVATRGTARRRAGVPLPPGGKLRVAAELAAHRREQPVAEVGLATRAEALVEGSGQHMGGDAL